MTNHEALRRVQFTKTGCNMIGKSQTIIMLAVIHALRSAAAQPIVMLRGRVANAGKVEPIRIISNDIPQSSRRLRKPWKKILFE